MVMQIINHGSVQGDGTGESPFTGMQKANANFAELYDMIVNRPSVLFGLPCPVVLAPTGTMAANGAVTFGTALSTNQIMTDGLFVYFPAGAVYSGSLAGLYWTVMSSHTVGTVYNTRSDGFIAIPGTITPVVAAGPGAFTGVTGSDIDLFKYQIPDNLLGRGDMLQWRFSISHTNSANNKIYRGKIGTTTLMSPTYTTSDGWNNEITLYRTGSNLLAYPQGWNPITDANYTAADLGSGANRILSMTVNRSVATELIRVNGANICFFPAPV